MRRVYSAEVIDHFQNPRNVGEIPNADGYARITGPCGDTIQICLRVKDDTITEARFMTNGCGASIACASTTTELASGKSISGAMEITSEDILRHLNGLPESELHCSELAADALRTAIRDYLSIRREPWKKSYRSIEPF
jgi:nitrogen fixation NifU-like protein